LNNSNEKEIILNNNDLSNNGIYSDISANNKINMFPKELTEKKRKSSKKYKIDNLVNKSLTEEENAYYAHKNNLEDNDGNLNVDNSKITITSNINNTSNENQKYNSSAESIKGNDKIENNYIKKDEYNSNEFLIEENSSFNCNYLNIENLKEKNDINIIIQNNKDITPTNNIDLLD